MFRKSFLIALLIAVMSISSAFAAGNTRTLEVDISGLSNLGPDFDYEGWIIVDGQPFSTGVFDIEEGASGQTVAIDADLADNAFAYVLTIEPVPDPDPAPASTHALAGEFNNGAAVLGVEHPAALGSNFADAAGSYILAAPSGDNAPYYNGFWFLRDGEPSLELPVLPEGWAYEGWVVDENGPVSTGTFTDVAAADSNGAGPAGGPNAFPNYPGEDFVNPARDLRGNTVVISIEPVPDNSPAPFDYKPLVDINVDDTLGPGASQFLQQNLGSLASGTATFTDAAVEDVPAAPAAPAVVDDNVVVFAVPTGGEGPAPAFPGEAYEFSFNAAKGESLHLATMLVQTNDWFFSPNAWGIPLYDSNGDAITGNVTDYIHLYDAGTEIDERVGVGPNQAPRQAGPNTGPADTNVLVRRAHDNDGITPAVNQLINATLAYNGDGNFTFRIENVSAGTALPGPIAPGVAVVTAETAPIFSNGFQDRGLGLEELAEDGMPGRLADNLR